MYNNNNNFISRRVFFTLFQWGMGLKYLMNTFLYTVSNVKKCIINLIYTIIFHI